MRRLKRKKAILWVPVLLMLTVVLLFVAIRIEPDLWGYARSVSAAEEVLRNRVVDTATTWLGCNEKENTHRPIIDLYNSHMPLARGYAVQYDDAWCSTFVSAVAIACDLTDIIPTECGCERQIELFMELNAWEEEDTYLPLPGDCIFYHWGCTSAGDCDHWSDHVGIVVGTWNGWIKVVEGNKDEAVRYRWLRVGSRQIRGYGIPDYANMK